MNLNSLPYNVFNSIFIDITGFRQNSHHQRSASQKYMTGRRPVINERRSVSPQPRIITSMASCEVDQKTSPMIRNGVNSTRSAPLSQDKSQIGKLNILCINERRSVSPQPRIITSMVSCEVDQKPLPMIRNGVNWTRSAPLSQDKSQIGKVHIGHKILRNLHLTFDWHYIGQK